MYDILLLNPSLQINRYRDEGYKLPWVDGGHGWMPQFALFLAPYVKRHGFSVKVLDMELYSTRREKQLIAEYAPQARYIGVSAMTAQTPHGLALTRQVKKIAPRTPVVWGGIHPSLLPEQTVEHPLVDYVIAGEGEEPLTALLAGRDHPRIGAADKKVDMTVGQQFLKPQDLCEPDYDELDMDRYFKFHGGALRNVDILTSRGCPLKCSFCINTIMKNHWRGFTADRCIEIIRTVYEKHRARHVFFLDENFFGRASRIQAITKYLSQTGLTWEANITVQHLLSFDDDNMKFLRDSGAICLRMGAESASDRLLKIIQKNITKELIVAARDKCLKFGITPSLSLMSDLPDELPEEKVATAEFAVECRQAGAIVLGPQIFRPYPGSAEFIKLVERGLKLPKKLEDWAVCDLFNATIERRESIFRPVLDKYKPVIKHLIHEFKSRKTASY